MAERLRGLLLLKNDVICWVITVGGRGWGRGAENNADCLHALKTLFSFFCIKARTGVSPSKAVLELGELPNIALVNLE